MPPSRRGKPEPAEAPSEAQSRPVSLVDAYDNADLTPATKGLWPPPPASADQPLVSIVTLTLDGAELVERLLTSFEQVNSYPNVEIIVVDHGSRDDTLDLLRRWSERLPVRIVARGANHSFAASNNRGARLASGELILILNNDMVFTEDVLPDMVAMLADQAVGIVGLKQYQPALTPSARRVYHAGVRFLWNVVERRLRPYHVRPGPLDARLSVEPAAMPAVTASLLLCRRQDFLEIGGFHEGYFYGLEDVDFCCRMRWRLGKAVVCLNSRSALHYKNSTRDRDPESRRPTEKANRRILQARCGYRIRREFITSRFDDDGSFTGARFTVGIAVPTETALAASETCPSEFGLGEALRRQFGWDVRYLPTGWSGRAQNFDLYVGRADSLAPEALIDAQPHLVSALWSQDPSAPRAPGWDLQLCPSQAALDALAPADRASALVLAPIPADERPFPELPSPEGEAGAKALHERLRSLFTGLRVAVKQGPAAEPKEAALADEIAQALLRQGVLARIDQQPQWLSPRSVGDDVAIVLPSAAAYRPWPDQINLRLLAGREAADGFDATVKVPAARGRRAGAEPVSETLWRLIQELHARRMAGPDDDAAPAAMADDAGAPEADVVSADF